MEGPRQSACGQQLYYTTIGLLVCYRPPRALLLVAAQAIGFRLSGRGDPETRCIRALAPLEWVSLALPEQARVFGGDGVGFAASANSGDKPRLLE